MKKNILQLIILVIILSFFVGCSAIKSSIQSKSMEVKKNIKLPLGGKIIIFNGIPDFSFKEGVKGSCSKEEIVNAGVEIGNYIAELVSKKLSSSINKNSFVKIEPIKTSSLPYKGYSFEFSKVLGTKMDGITYVWKKNEYLDCNWENLVAVSNRPDLYDSHSIKTEDIKEQGDYLIIIWPYQWFSYTTEDTPNEYSSYVVYGLYDAKTGEQIAIGSKHEDSTCDKCGEEMSRTIAEKISSDIISTLFK